MAITIDLPTELADHAKQVAVRTGRTLEAVLVDWLERAALDEALLDPNTTHRVYTPYGNDHAAAILAEALSASAEDEG
jgi:hypothetical protein